MVLEDLFRRPSAENPNQESEIDFSKRCDFERGLARPTPRSVRAPLPDSLVVERFLANFAVLPTWPRPGLLDSGGHHLAYGVVGEPREIP